MKFSQETLMAYADGELDAQTRRAIEAAMASDGEIAAQVERHRALRSTLGGAFSGVLDEEIPERLMEAARSSPADAPSLALPRRPGEGRERERGSGVTDLAAARAAKTESGRKRNWSWPEWTSIAASLVIGVIAGRSVLQTSTTDSTWLATNNNGVVATGALAVALSEQAGGTRASGSSVDIGVSFRAKSAAYCRTFSSHDEGAMAGLACRDADQWRVHALTQDESAPADGDYRMAGAQLPPLIRQAVEATIEGDALDAEEESAARARGWK